jgi:hypothetical protein
MATGIPVDLWRLIFLEVEVKNLAAVSLVCRSFHSALGEEFWRLACRRKFIAPNNVVHWRDFFKRMHRVFNFGSVSDECLHILDEGSSVMLPHKNSSSFTWASAISRGILSESSNSYSIVWFNF